MPQVMLSAEKEDAWAMSAIIEQSSRTPTTARKVVRTEESSPCQEPIWKTKEVQNPTAPKIEQRTTRGYPLYHNLDVARNVTHIQAVMPFLQVECFEIGVIEASFVTDMEFYWLESGVQDRNRPIGEP
jgi:hypothetical protein